MSSCLQLDPRERDEEPNQEMALNAQADTNSADQISNGDEMPLAPVVQQESTGESNQSSALNSEEMANDTPSSPLTLRTKRTRGRPKRIN